MTKKDLFGLLAQSQDGRLTDTDSGIDKIIVDAIEKAETPEDVYDDLKYAIHKLQKAKSLLESTTNIDVPLDGELGLTKLGERNYTLISKAIKSEGSYNPELISCYFIEELYIHEADDILEFLAWVHENNLNFGRANYEQTFKEFIVDRENKKVTG